MKLAPRIAASIAAVGLVSSLASCGLDNSRNLDHVEGAWILAEFDEAEIKADPAVTTRLVLEGGSATGNGGVNNFKGTYDAPEDGKISFSRLAGTKMAGDENAMLQEQRFLAEMERITNFEYDEEDRELELKDDRDETLLTFRSE